MKNALEKAREYLRHYKYYSGFNAFEPKLLAETLDSINKVLEPEEHWIIKKVPNTKDEYYVESGRPPKEVLDVYGIS